MEQFGQYAVKPASEMMMLGVGQPSPQILKEANNFIKLNELENNDINLLQYGLKQGFSSYRKFIKKLLGEFSNVSNDETKEDNIYMTNGISQSIFMISSLLRSTYDTVYVEDLTYFIMINVFKDLKYNIKTFNITDMNKLQSDLKKEKNGALVYCIPFCNNPTGLTMKNNQLTDFLNSIQESTIILSDETYQFLHYNLCKDNIPNKPIAFYKENIISLGTLLNILCPNKFSSVLHS